MIAASNDGAAQIVAREAVADFARRCGLELLRFAYVLCGDRFLAEDLLQDVLFAMHRRFPDGLSIENPLGYARRALANRNISRARRAAASEIVVGVFPDAAAWDADRDAADRDLLWQAVRRLPVRQRTVLVLRYFEDATDEDIAAMLHCRRGTVRSLASRALATLRDDQTLIDGGDPR